MNNEVILEIKDIKKSYGPVQALSGVSFSIRRGTIHGLIGENGSGKSTVSSIISGIHKADSGEMYLKGKPYKPSDMIDAQNNLISMVVQEIGTISGISTAANIFAGDENLFKSGPFISKRKMEKTATEILKKTGAGHIDSSRPIDSYNLEDRKLVEIARCMFSEPEILIIDETTTALSHHGRDILYSLIKQMKHENKAVLFITHDLEELMEICDVLTILRDGEYIDSLNKEDFNEKKIKSLMVGRELSEKYYREDQDGSAGEKVVLRVDNLSIGRTLQDVSLRLHEGEILGIGGLSGSGMHELGRAVFGLERVTSGSIMVNEKNIDNPLSAIRESVGYISKNRDEEALITTASIKDNIALPSLPELSAGFIISPRREKQFVEQQVNELRIKCSSMFQDVSTLSGGNKQKVSFGRWIGKGSDILVMDCPTRGIDVGVKASMYELMYRLKLQGKSILIISEELPELIGMSDRVILLKNGRISKTFHRGQLDENAMIEYII